MSNGGNFHVAAIGFRGKQLFWGVNQKKSHPKTYHVKPSGHRCFSTHAEHDLLRHGHMDAIYVIRFLADGTVSMAKPCPDCEGKLRTAGVRKVYYTDFDGKWQTLKLR